VAQEKWVKKQQSLKKQVFCCFCTAFTIILDKYSLLRRVKREGLPQTGSYTLRGLASLVVVDVKG